MHRCGSSVNFTTGEYRDKQAHVLACVACVRCMRVDGNRPLVSINNIFWRHSHRYHRKFMQYKGRPNRIKWKMELRRWRHSIFHFSFSIFHSQWKMESIWRRMHFRFSDINRKWKMDYWCHRFHILARMKNEKWKMEVDIPFFIWWLQMKNQNNGMYTDPTDCYAVIMALQRRRQDRSVICCWHHLSIWHRRQRLRPHPCMSAASFIFNTTRISTATSL